MPVAVKSRKNPYRTILLKKRQELLASVKSEPDALDASIRTPDEDEFAVKAVEQEVTASMLELRSRMLKEIDRSLQRLAEGTYGICEGCGEEISPARLKAIPWAHFCLTCQDQHSRN